MEDSEYPKKIDMDGKPSKARMTIPPKMRLVCEIESCLFKGK